MKIPSITRSILRYPGSKARLAKFIAKAIEINSFKSPVLLEPFCGGSSVSIALLESGVVGSIAINDIDPLISSLWKCVFSKDDSKWLADKVMNVPLTLDHWYYQKELNPKSIQESALKCLYLNRTSFSGVLQDRAGPIGGKSQAKWTVGCRFNRQKISKRILELSSLLDRVVSVSGKPWQEFCQGWEGIENTVCYLDPPFYYKAERLYRYCFDEDEHVRLNNFLLNADMPWLLSYDNAEKIRQIYNGNGLRARQIDNTYSAHPIGGNSFIGKEIVYSNFRVLPGPTGDGVRHEGLSVKRPSKARIVRGDLVKVPCPVI